MFQLRILYKKKFPLLSDKTNSVGYACRETGTSIAYELPHPEDQGKCNSCVYLVLAANTHQAQVAVLILIIDSDNQLNVNIANVITTRKHTQKSPPKPQKAMFPRSACPSTDLHTFPYNNGFIGLQCFGLGSRENELLVLLCG